MIAGIPQPLEILHGGGVAMACAPDGQMRAEEAHGLFAGDTRVLSSYRLAIAGHAWRLLARSRSSPSIGQWDFQNPTVRAPTGDLGEGTLHLRLRRRLERVMHDCLTVRKFGSGTARIRLSLLIDADMADVFEVKSGSQHARLNVQRIPRLDGVMLLYRRRDFVRGLRVRLTPSSADMTLVGTQVLFDLVLSPGQEWTCCLEAAPFVDGRQSEFFGDPHDHEPEPGDGPSLLAPPLLSAPFERGRTDLLRLAIPASGGGAFVAAGAPWFMALFGRDTLVTSLMTGLLGSVHAEGALQALADLQADHRDDYRDAEPGKLPHELRRGELAHFGLIPHTPYYGTHDSPALYALTLWNAFRWTGDRQLLARYLPVAMRAMKWCETLGDRDQDGFLEYSTRSSNGYENQSWKDAGDAIVHADGSRARTPLATVELQGYWFAALLALAELLEAEGDAELAAVQRGAAQALRARVEERFWWAEADAYYLALDADKQPVRTLASNAGHLLWCGLPSPDRARRLVRRLLAPEMFSGYGLRTLSAKHPAYNPLSYQLGSVWPHDTALVAAGCARYGLRDEAATLLHGILEAAAQFEQQRLPELFCGLSHEEGPPVPYFQANSPQAWAAAVPVLATQIFLGLQPDAPAGRCFLDPWLPTWLPTLALEGVAIGQGRLDVRLVRRGTRTLVDHLEAHGLDAHAAAPQAPLWGPLEAAVPAPQGRRARR